MTDEVTKALGTNLVGVIKSVAREVYTERERADRFERTSNAGAKWSYDEEVQLLNELETAVSIIAALHRRNPGGIKARIVKMAEEHKL